MPAEHRNQVRQGTNVETLRVSIIGQTLKGPVRISRTDQILRTIQGS
jgi:hypothetical protein